MINDIDVYGFPDDIKSQLHKKVDTFRKYDIYNNMDQKTKDKMIIIHNTYKMQRTNINYFFNSYLINKYCNFNSLTNFWSLFYSLDGIVDLSDPDTSLPNSLHALQTAEAIRKAGKPDWYILCGLIHDMGKILYLSGKDEDGTSKTTQWAVVGDTFITGSIIPSNIVLSCYNNMNIDHNNNIIIPSNIGLSNCSVSFGHDEYMYRILKKCTTLLQTSIIPQEALYIIRYHSLYAWHSSSSYDYLMDDTDRKMKSIVKEFSSFDLYTKDDMNIIKWNYELKDFYTKLVKKYISKDMMIVY